MLSETSSPDGNSVTYKYDDNGNLILMESKRGKSVTRHDFKYSDGDHAVDYKR